MSDEKQPVVVVGKSPMTEEQQRKVSEDLKAKAASASSAAGQRGTIRVRVRSARENGHYRAGRHFTQDDQEIVVTHEELNLLRADRSLLVEGIDAPLDASKAKWPPEGLTPETSPQMRGAPDPDRYEEVTRPETPARSEDPTRPETPASKGDTERHHRGGR
jgi:hypothetical protein